MTRWQMFTDRTKKIGAVTYCTKYRQKRAIALRLSGSCISIESGSVSLGLCPPNPFRVAWHARIDVNKISCSLNLRYKTCMYKI